MDPRLQQLILAAPVLLFSMVAHEYAHGYAALRQGDPTAAKLGRLTWNPAKHIDPFMTIILPAMLAYAGGPILGGAKPVPVDARNFRSFRRGDIIVSLAGIASNVLIAIACLMLVAPLYALGRAVPAAATSLSILQVMLVKGIWINLVLALFNLMPIPPLDGSRVVVHMLPPALSLRYQQLGRYGVLVLVVLLWFGGPVIGTWLAPAYSAMRAAESWLAPYLLPTPWLS